MRHAVRSTRYALLAGLLVATLAGCEEDVTAILGTAQAFTLYGVIDPQADTQFVRVFPIAGLLGAEGDAPIDGRFVSTDAATGEQRVWTETLIVDEWGDHAHVFWSPFRAAYGRGYTVSVEGADGRASSAAVVVPGQSVVREGEPLIAAALQPIRVEGDVDHLNRAEGIYWIGYRVRGLPAREFREYRFPLSSRPLPGAAGWEIQVNFADAHARIENDLATNPDYLPALGIVLARITVRAVAASEAWRPPNDAFDPLLLVEPGVLTNVENGFGLLAAGYRIAYSWVPPDEVITRGGFRIWDDTATP